MANWCITEYTVVGEPSDVQGAYNLMRELEQMETPSIENGFGSSFLGCLVNALGGDWQKSLCRGRWYNLKCCSNRLTFTTETAGYPLNDVWDMLCERFPSLSYYYCAVEPGCEVFQTNDSEGLYYPQHYWASIFKNEDCEEQTFITAEDAMQWFYDKTGIQFRSLSELNDYSDADGNKIYSVYPIEAIDHDTDYLTRKFLKAIIGIK